MAERLSSIEINGSFYALQRPESYRSWREQTPDDFCFAVKGGRFITHMKRLADVETPLANFFASGVLALGRQARPGALAAAADVPVRCGTARRPSSTCCPDDDGQAAELAEQHDERVGDDAVTVAEVTTGRDPARPRGPARLSFVDAGLPDLLREHDIGLVVADTAGKWPLIREVTSDFAYVRLHGDTELYASGYDAEALDAWAALGPRVGRARARTCTSTSTTT